MALVLGRQADAGVQACAGRVFLKVQLRAMQFGDACHDRQAEPATALIAVLQAMEAALGGGAFGGRNAGAAVADAEFNAFVVRAEADADAYPPVCWRVADGVVDEIADQHP